MIPQLRNGCCRCSLQTSSLVIAWISVMISGTCLVMFVTGGTAYVAIVLETSEKDDLTRSAVPLSIVLAVCIGIIIINLLISIGLLVGIYKRNYCLMMPYLILGGVMNVVNVLFSVLIFSTIFNDPINLCGFIIHGIVAALFGYFWLILYSLHIEIKIGMNVNENTTNDV